MKQYLTVLFLLDYIFCFSQNEYSKIPVNTTHIHFACKQSTKIFINETGVYAGSLFFQQNFPKVK
jgi:hypothetical protein